MICTGGRWRIWVKMGIVVNQEARDWVEGETVARLLGAGHMVLDARTNGNGRSNDARANGNGDSR